MVLLCELAGSEKRELDRLDFEPAHRDLDRRACFSTRGLALHDGELLGVALEDLRRGARSAMRTSNQIGNETYIADGRRLDVERRRDVDDAMPAKRLIQAQNDRLRVLAVLRKVVVLAALDRVEDDVAAAVELERVVDGDGLRDERAREAANVLRRVEEPACDGDVGLGK